MVSDHIALFAHLLGAGRIAIGLAPFLAADRLSKLLGFPAAHDNASARLMARLFGVRDAGLGVLVLYCARDAHLLGLAAIFNLFMDAGDIVSAAIPLARRHGIDRGALGTMGFAACGLCCWVALIALVG